MRAALERMLALTDEARARMGEAARARVEAEFGEQQVVHAALAVVREIEGGRE